MKENALERLLVVECRRAGSVAAKLMPTQSGMPDRIVLYPGGGTRLVELKTDNGRLSSIQKHRHNQLRRLGHEVVTLYGAEQVREFARRKP